MMGLGYAAGREKKFTAEQVMGLNELAFVYALPTLMFVGTVTTTRTSLLGEVAYLPGRVSCNNWIFCSGCLSQRVCSPSFVRRIHANLVTFPSVAFWAFPFGSASIVLVKMIGQPALMALLVALVGIRNPLGQEAIVLCAIPASGVAPLLGSRYHVYETEVASTLVLTTLMMIVTLPLTIVLIGA